MGAGDGGLASAWFAHPWLVAAGLMAAGVPIVIHWFNRRRVRTVEWAAMRLLVGAYQRDERRVRLEDLLLLALRVALMLLAGLLVARPQFRERGWLATSEPIEFVVVLDDSLSMQAIGSDGTAFSLALRRIMEWIESRSTLGRDTLTLRLASSPDDSVLQRAPLSETRLAATIAAIERLTASDRRVDWPTTIGTLREKLEAPEKGKQVVLIVSDFRAADWMALFESGFLATNSPSTSVPRGATWLACDVGSDSFENLSLESLEPDGIAAEGVAVTYRAVLRNLGSRTARDVSVEFQAGETAPRRAVVAEVSPGETATVEWPLTVPRRDVEEANAGLEVSATIVRDAATVTDGAPRDDTRLDVASSDAGIRVVIVADEIPEADGANRRNAKREVVELMSRALAPSTEWPSGFQVRVATAAEWSAELERGSDAAQTHVVIVIDEGIGWSAGARKRLAAWVDRGGILLLVPHASVDASLWNERWYDSAARFSPLGLQALAGDERRERWLEFGMLADDWAAARSWKAWNDSPFAEVKVFRWWESQPLANKNSAQTSGDAAPRVLVTLAGEAKPALLVERIVGRGRCWWCAVPLDQDSCDWSLDPSFVLFWQEALRDAGQRGQWPRVIDAGDAVMWEEAVTTAGRQASLITPAKERWALTADASSADSGVWRFRSPLTRHAGFYSRVTSAPDGKQATTRMAVNVAAGESDLRPLAASSRSEKAEIAERWLTADRPWSEQLEATGEGWTWVAWSAMILLALEQSWAWFVGKRRG